MKDLSIFIALRYFFSKKSQGAINVVSGIASTGVMVGTAALIIVLSVFNGFQDLVLKLYNSFDPDIRIELSAGKRFPASELPVNKLRSVPGVAFVTPVIEESALVKYRDRQHIIKLKGVGEDFVKMTGLDTMMIDGNFYLERGDTNYAVLGSTVAYNLGLDPSNIFAQVEIYGPRSNATSLTDAAGAFNREFVRPAGVFAVQQDYDSKYVLVPLRLARDVLGYDDMLTSMELGLTPGADPEEVMHQVSAVAGDNFVVKDRQMQHALLYSIMRSEKWAVFMILTFILIIAVFNVISSLTMLVMEKRKDMVILRSMGAEVGFLRRIFLIEGMLITLAGAVTGLVIGLIICYLQQRFGLIGLGGSGSFVVDAYPVKINPLDVLFVFAAVGLIGLIAAWYPARRLITGKVDLRMVEEE